MQSGPVCRIPPDVCILSPPGPGDLRIHGPTPGGICLHDTDDAEVTDECVCLLVPVMGCFLQTARLCTPRWSSVEAFVVPLEAPSAQHLSASSSGNTTENAIMNVSHGQLSALNVIKSRFCSVPLLWGLSGKVDCRSLCLQHLESCSASRLASWVLTGRLFYYIYIHISQTCSGPNSASTTFEGPLSFLRVCSFLLLKQVDQRFQNLFERL